MPGASGVKGKDKRQRIRRQREVREGRGVKVGGGACGLMRTDPGLFKDNPGKRRAAVSPECGDPKLYLADAERASGRAASGQPEQRWGAASRRSKAAKRPGSARRGFDPSDAAKKEAGTR